MALPHGESAALAAQLPDARIVDLSADFRLGDEAAWHQFYGDARYAGRWAYGLPELPGAPGADQAPRATVAAPGCYATTSILALAPLLAAGLVEPDDIVIVAASGTSGAGRSPRADLLASEVMGSMSAYKVGGTHRHTPEIEQALSEVLPAPRPGDALLHPDAGPDAPRHPRHLHRPAHAGRRATAGPDGALRGRVRRRLRRRAVRAPAARRASGRSPRAVSGSNGAHVQVAADPHAGRAVVVADHRQPRQGRGRPGRADRQPHARPAGDGRPDHPRSRTMSVDRSPHRASAPPASTGRA